MKGSWMTIVSLLLMAASLSAQDFGFGFDDEEGGVGSDGSAFRFSIGGEVSAGMTGFFDDFSEGVDAVRLGDIFSGTLDFSAETAYASGVINLELSPAVQPVEIDEAYIRAYFASFDVEAGLRKLTWGKADSMGPLDVINPLDYSDLSGFSDIMSLKIARPLVHASLLVGQFSKLEGVFVPNFEAARFAETGRWTPSPFVSLSKLPPQNIIRPDTTTLDYAQGGLRFTTTIGGAADIGAQYYYGRFTIPAVTQDFLATPLPIATFAYNPYHQIGLDYAQVIAGFNLRAEVAANITEDLTGDDGAVNNPSLAWSLGFDRDLFAGVTFTIQCNETIRLLDAEISDPLDIEAESAITSTRIILQLAKKFFQDTLELNTRALWDLESRACLLMPGLTWTRNDVALTVSSGIFLGSDQGLFGQFHDNSFVKLGISYTF